MSRALNPWDPQNERIFLSDGTWHSLSANTGGGQSRDCVIVPLIRANERPRGELDGADCGQFPAGRGQPGQGSHACYTSGIDCRNGTLTGGVTHTLQAKPGGGFSLNCTPSVVIALTNRGYPTGGITETMRADCHQAIPICCYRRTDE